MQKILLTFFLFSALFSFSQSDNCSTATSLTVNASCVGTAGTTTGATQSIPGCSGNADDDVWYKFTATAASQVVTVNSSATFDAVAQLFSGACGGLVSLYCQDVNFNGQSETIYATGLTIGSNYYIRVYNYNTGSGSATFTICVTTPPAAPGNNSCFSPTALTVNAACSNTAGTTYGATQSYTSACGGTPDDDVWYTFVANNAQQVITVTPSGSMDPVFELLTGSCGAFTSLYCEDNTLSGAVETVTAVGLTPGQTYYIRVYDYYGGNGGYPFQICVTGVAGTGDNPCNAYVLPAVTSDCNYNFFSTTAASSTGAGLAPTPASCGGSSPFQGGFSGTSKDIWFSVVVPASGSLYITPEPNIGAGAITDGVFALYSGTCGALTQVACNDDNNFPGSANDLLPYIAATGLTPGATMYIRFWGYGSSSGTMGICVSSPTNDACANALYICDLNGYSASTSAAYTPDRPCNMRGDNEDAAGVDLPDGTSVVDGIYPAGIFGIGGSWGTGQPGTGIYDVDINNNSWIKFTASATTATFSVSVGNCWVGNYPSGGIQMQIFAGTNCCNFIPVSDFKESSTGFVLTANSLTAGQTYYLMIDGFAGDICNYTIRANSGVLFPGITAVPSTICYADSTTLTGPNGASSYQWTPGGSTSQSITVAPPSTQNYTCVVSGVCGDKQTLTKTVTVNPKPIVLINGSAAATSSVCTTSNFTLTASGGSTYSWSTGASSSSIVIVAPSPSVSAVYTVTGTDINGCKNTASFTVTGLPLPTFTLTNASPSVCFGQSVTLTANPPALTYSWSTGASGQSISVSPGGNTSYTVIGTDGNGCKSNSVANVTVLALPTVSANTVTICNTQTATLTASGASTYSWSTAQSGSSITVNPGTSTSYTVVGTGANTCTNSAVATVTVNPLPNVTVNSAVICNGTNATLNANGAVGYAWSNAQSGPSISVNPTATTSYTVTGTNGNGCVKSAVATVTVNPVPVLTSAPTVSPSNCGGSTGSVSGVVVTGSGSLTYTWTNSSNVVVGNAANLPGQPAGIYNLTVTDGNGCTSTFGPYSITNPGSPPAPSVVVNDTTVCVGQSVTLTASSSIGGATFSWTGPGLSSNNATITLNPALVSQSGTYAVTATSAGCTGPSKNITVTVYALPVVTAASQNSAYCSGSSIILLGSGGGTYSWIGPSTYTSSTQNPTIPNSTTANAGTYTLTVTDANGCVNTDTALVNVNQTPSITSVSVVSPTICAGQTIQLNATASTGGTTFSWTGPNGYSSSSQNNTIPGASVVQGGTYSVTSTLNGCTSAAGTVAVVVNPNPTAAAVTSNSLVCSGATEVLTGGGGGTYAWTGPGGFTSASQTVTLNNVLTSAGGTYTLVVTNAFNCKDSTNVSFAVNPTPTVSIASAGAVVCEGQAFQLNANVNPSGATFTWLGPGAFTSTNQNNTISNATPTQSGTYSVSASLGGCTSSVATVAIVVNPTPTAAVAIGGTVFCSGTNVNLSGGGGGVYAWSGPGGFIASTQNVTLPNVLTTAAGTYTLVVTNAFGCKDSSNLTFAVNPTPTVSISSAGSTICEGQSFQLNANATPTVAVYNWTGPGGFTSTQQNNTISNAVITQSGTYSVTASLSGCVSTASTVTVVVNPNPTAVATISNTVTCSGSNVNMSGSGGGTYAWSGPSGFSSTQQNPTITNTQVNESGNYTLTVTNGFGCTDTAQVSLTVNQTPAPAVTTGASTCKGDTLSLSATGTGTIDWYNDATLTTLVLANSSTYTPTASGTQTYYVTVTSAAGCTSAAATVTANNYNLQVGATADVFNGYAPLAVNFTSTVVGATSPSYNWTFGDSHNSSNANPSNTYSNGGTFSVTLIVTDVSGCMDTVTLQIHVEEDMEVIIPNIFSPNADLINDIFATTIRGAKSAEGWIFNRWGQLVYSWDSLNSNWDGKMNNGNNATDGTYYYLIKVTSLKDVVKEFKGPLTLVR